MVQERNQWFVTEQSSPQPKMRLICCGYAGGNSRVFAGWQARFGSDIEVLAVETPGRGRRFKEAPIADLRDLTQQLCEASKPLLDRPFALFGHSNGALLAYELARAIRRRYLLSPQALFLSGKRAPQLLYSEAQLHRLPDAEFIAALQRYNGTPQEVLENPELLSVFLPILRADFALSETYRFTPGDPITAPVYLFGGAHDAVVPERDLLAWGDACEGEVYYRRFAGDHFFIHSQRDQLIAVIKEALTAAVEPRTDSWDIGAVLTMHTRGLGVLA
jgi:medium-chain acyl-[acyl-carrier-protein] hydrolase